jgi:CHAT domain-containing protein
LAGCRRDRAAEDAYAQAQASYRRGDLDRAAAESLRQAERWRSDSASQWFWNFRLLAAEALTAKGKYGDAEDLLRDPIPEHWREVRARQFIDRASLSVNRLRDGRNDLRQGRALLRGDDLSIRADLVEGVQALNEHRDQAAQEVFHRALARAQRVNDVYLQASALSNLAFSAKRLNRLEESVEYGERAVSAAAQCGALRIEAVGRSNVGSSYALLGEFDAALKHERRAIDMLGQMGMRPGTMIALGELALAEDLSGDPNGATPLYRKAYDMAVELDRRADATRFAESLALMYIKAKQWPLAAEWNQRAEDLATANSTIAGYLERNRALIARATGHPDEAVRIARRLATDPKTPPEMQWVAHDLLGRLYSDAGRKPQAGAEFARALAQIDGAQSALADSQHKISLLSYLISFYQDYVQMLADEKDDAGALRVIESSRARVLGERLGRAVHPAAISPAAVQDFARRARTCVLTFWLAPQGSYAWLIRPDGVRRIALPPEPEVQALVTAYRRVVEHSVQDPLAVADPALWNRVLAPAAGEIPKGSRVIVIPDGPLHRLNLETLVVPGPAPHYWIEDAEVEVAPSISIAMAARPAAGGDRGLLLIGDPDYRGTGYETLSGAAREVREIAARMPTPAPAIYTGSKAFPGTYREAQPGRFREIHFAAHAEANEEKPLESAVVLSRAGDSYKLYARDVVEIPIHADLVTLSACRSAGAREYAGEGLIGFVWAFLEAGARTVVAGLWDVSDVSAAPLMARFYEGVAAGREPVTALREAKLAILRGQPRFRKAFYWGAFQAYVGPGAARP